MLKDLVVEVNESNSKKIFKIISATFVEDSKRQFPSDNSRYEFIRERIGKKYDIKVTEGNYVFCYLKDTSGRLLDSEGSSEGFVTQNFQKINIKKDRYLTIETKDFNYIFILEEFEKTEVKL